MIKNINKFLLFLQDENKLASKKFRYKEKHQKHSILDEEEKQYSDPSYEEDHCSKSCSDFKS